jgi:hypothetical protein
MPFVPGKLGSILASAISAAVVASGVSTEAGQPVQRFVKDIIKAGRYLDPHSGKWFDVTTEDLDHWALTFGRMDAAGVKVPVPDGHTDKASANRGFVRGMFREGDTLKASIDLIGEEAIKLAAVNDVSVYVPTSFTDGKGNTYARPITHVAITTYPVVPGMGPFVPIVASAHPGDSEKAPVLRLAEGASQMEMLKTIAAALGISAEGLDEASLGKAITAAIAEWKTEMSGSKAEKETATTALAAAHKTIEGLKTATKSDPDPMVLKLAGKNRGLEIDGLVSSGHITPASALKFKAAWMGDALKLSLDPVADDLFDKTIAAIKASKPTELREHLDGQSLQLSRVVPGDREDDKPIPQAEIDERAKKLYGKGRTTAAR